MKKGVIFLLCLLGALSVDAQRITPQQYIERFKDIAIAEMHRTGVPASIKLAQGILESESGNGNLVKRSNNHFGIKCKSYWTGPSVSHDDDEKGECFRKYEHPEESYRDHSDFLVNSERYAALFKLKKTDYKGWAHGLKKAGYATNPRYPQLLIYQIEKYKLYEFDHMPDNRASLAYYDDDQSTASTDAVVEAEEKITPTVVKEVPATFEQTPYDIGAVIKRNGLKAVFVGEGTSLLAIATRHKIDLSKLLDYNDLDGDGLLDEESWIYLERKHSTSSQDYHVAEEGDSYHSISQSFGVQLAKLLKYNNVEEDDVVPAGTKVWLQPQDVAVKKDKKIIHQVQPKEGLYSIAKKYNVTVEDIRKANNLKSDHLQIGQKLIISK